DRMIEVGMLTARVIAARNVKAAVEGSFYGLLSPRSSNCYCRLQVGDSMQTSSTARQTLNPQWNREQFFFPVMVS
ncbi:hypothetical protein JKP88DRAFT_137159, partial [Tribonema minus]